MQWNVVLGELIGTAVLVLLGNGVVANVLLKKSKGMGSGWIVITAGWGLAVAMAVYLTSWMTGAYLNPAVTVGFALTGAIGWDIVPSYIVGQLVGAFIGSIVVWLTYFNHFAQTSDGEMKLLCFATKPAIRSPFWNFLTEVVGTMVLMLGILGIFDPHNQVGPGVGPYLVGMLVFAIGLSLGGPTGYAINPARDLGPRIAHALLPIAGKGGSDWSYAWVPIVGPIVGAALGVAVYSLLL